MIEQFMETDIFKSEANYLRAYGGPVELPVAPQVMENGVFSIGFSRPIIFPVSLLEQYNTDYVEEVP